MLRKIWNTIKAIGAFFSAVAGFIQDMIESIIKFFSLLPKAVSYVTSSIGFLPTTILSMIGVMITILVVRKIINR